MSPALAEAVTRRTRPGLALADDAERIARACHAMAAAFHRGGRLITFGNGGGAADAAHLAVEFTHPVIVGKRALPAFSLANDAATLTAIARTDGYGAAFAAQVRLLGRPGDIAVGILDGHCANVAAALDTARDLGMLTIALCADTTLGAHADHVLAAHSDDPLVAAEIRVTTYHILWELVHVFFEHPALLDAAPRR